MNNITYLALSLLVLLPLVASEQEMDSKQRAAIKHSPSFEHLLSEVQKADNEWTIANAKAPMLDENQKKMAQQTDKLVAAFMPSFLLKPVLAAVQAQRPEQDSKKQAERQQMGLGSMFLQDALETEAAHAKAVQKREELGKRLVKDTSLLQPLGEQEEQLRQRLSQTHGAAKAALEQQLKDIVAQKTRIDLEFAYATKQILSNSLGYKYEPQAQSLMDICERVADMIIQKYTGAKSTDTAEPMEIE